MKKDTIYKVIGATILIVGGYVAYKKLHTKKPTESDINVIVNSGNSENKEGLLKLGKEYLSAWANAIRKLEKSFTFNGKTYNTTGGKAIK